MKHIVLHIGGVQYEAHVGFDVAAYIVSAWQSGDFRPDGFHTNPGQMIVDLLYIAVPNADHDWRHYVETAGTSVIQDLFAARDQIVEATEAAAPEPVEQIAPDFMERMQVKHVD